MACNLNLWPRTEESLRRLENLLKCTICQKVLKDPYTLTSCGHTFCRLCIVGVLNCEVSKCPDCGLPGWLKDLQANRQLDNIVQLLLSMREQISSVSSTDEEMCISLLDTEQKDATSHGDRRPRVNPQIEAQMITRQWSNDVIPEVSRSEVTCNSDMTSYKVKADNGDPLKIHLCSEHGTSSKTSLPLAGIPPELKKKKRDPSTTIVTPFNRQLCRRKTVFKQSIITHNFVCVKSSGHHTDRHVASYDSKESGYQKLSCKNHQNKTLRQKHYGRSITTFTSEGVSSSTCASSSPTKSTVSKKIRRNIRGETPLHIAAIKGDENAVKVLLQQGAEPNAKDNAGWTPLHEACNHGHLAVVTVLLNSGALVNIPGLDNDTPLHDAVANNHVEVASLLISQGADSNLRNCRGETPRDLAITKSMARLFDENSFSLSGILTSQNALSPQRLTERQTELVLLGTGLKFYQKIKNKRSDNFLHAVHYDFPVVGRRDDMILTKQFIVNYFEDTVKMILSHQGLFKKIKQLERLSILLGAQVVDIFSLEVTHLVTVCDESGCCPRTLKFLCAVASGKWIVSFKWICKCLQDGCWVNEESYEVQGVNTGDSTVLSDAPRKSRENRNQQAPGLFDGCEFYFSGNFPPPGVSKEDLVYLVLLSGGKVLNREPISSDEGSPVYPFHARNVNCPICKFVVCDPCTEVPLKTIPKSVAVVPASWLLECLSHFELSDVPNTCIQL